MLNRTVRSEHGFTLVELLVVLILTGVVGGVVVSAIVSGLNTQQRTSERLDAVDELQVALQRSTRDLRVAQDIVLSSTIPAEEQVGAIIDRDGIRSLVVYRIETVDGEQQLVQIQSVGTGDQVERRLVTRVDNAEQDVPFLTYFNADGEELECSDTIDACRSTFLSATSVTLQITRAVEGPEPVAARTNVAIRNIRYGS